MTLPACQRIVVVGATGSGKTTLAADLALRLGLPHVELDALHWEPNWQPAAPERFRERVAQALAGERWVADGNYSRVRGVVWGWADTAVWLDYPLGLSLWRLLRRGLRRVITREALWNDNRESWRALFLSRDSLFLWALNSRPRQRRDYPALFASPAYAHLRLVRLRSPRAAADWLQSLPVGQ